ncbi:MAG: hypothetical protein AAFU41_18860, partial [Pseudomonadota bacterium]
MPGSTGCVGVVGPGSNPPSCDIATLDETPLGGLEAGPTTPTQPVDAGTGPALAIGEQGDF